MIDPATAVAVIAVLVCAVLAGLLIAVLVVLRRARVFRPSRRSGDEPTRLPVKGWPFR